MSNRDSSSAEAGHTIERVASCARCGGEHAGVTARKLTRPHAPREALGVVWTHWFPCPTTKEPVMVGVDSPPSRVLEIARNAFLAGLECGEIGDIANYGDDKPWDKAADKYVGNLEKALEL